MENSNHSPYPRTLRAIAPDLRRKHDRPTRVLPRIPEPIAWLGTMALFDKRLNMGADKADWEFLINLDLRPVDTKKIEGHVWLGFKRRGTGVHDFDEVVQLAVNRTRSQSEPIAGIDTALANGFTSIDIDLIDAPPTQNFVDFSHAPDRMIVPLPDRTNLCGFAHSPAPFKPQQRIADADLPTVKVCLQIIALTSQKLGDTGNIQIGMGDFSLPHDELAMTARQAPLQRNFQGHCARLDCELLAFGMSEIGVVCNTFSQNAKVPDQYYDWRERGELPILCGFEFNDDDRSRRDLILTLKCNWEVSVASFETSATVNSCCYFAGEWTMLLQLKRQGLIEIDDGRIRFILAGGVKNASADDGV